MVRAFVTRTSFAGVVLLFPTAQAVSQDVSETGTMSVFWPVVAVLAALVLGVALGVVRNQRQLASKDCSTDQLQTILGMMSAGVVGLDADTNIVMINASARRMLGGVAKATPFPWPSNIQFSNNAENTAIGSAETPLGRIKRGDHLAGEVFLMSRAARHEPDRPVRLTSAPLENVDGDLKVLMVFDDISLLTKTGTAEVVLGQMDVFSTLAQGISKDFSNALDAIGYAIETSLKQSLPEKPTSLLLTALSTVERSRNVTNKMTLLARQQDGQVSSRSVMSMLEDFKLLVPQSIDKNVTLAVNCIEPGLLVRCNQVQLENTLLTLVMNGCDAIMRHASGGTVTITAHLADASESVLQLRELHGTQAEFVEIIVSDDGPGMGLGISNQISNPLSRAGTEASDIGQGLEDVQSFVARVGGHLNARPNSPKGTSVHLILPLEHDVLQLPSDWQTPLPQGEGETVLVVEDDAMMLLMLQEALEELKYRVISATSGTAALGLLEQGVDFDLLITDIIMPGDIDGFDLVRQMRQKTEDAAVLYISGHTEFLSANEGPFDAPMLSKPCAANELANAVKAVLSKRPV